MRLLLRSAAAADLRAARKYYDESAHGLGDELAIDLDRLFARLVVFPHSAPLVDGYAPVRRARLRRFPYGVFYLPGEDRIDVLRIVHAARAPGAWRG
jgi:plasmid stabilization system protein ParE